MDEIKEENIRRKKDRKLSKHFDILINDQPYKIIKFFLKDKSQYSRFSEGKCILLISKFKLLNNDKKDVRIQINHNGESYDFLTDRGCSMHKVGEHIIEYYIKN